MHCGKIDPINAGWRRLCHADVKCLQLSLIYYNETRSMKNDTASRSSTVGICSDDGSKVSYDCYFSLDSKNNLTKSASQHRRRRFVQSFPPPPPPPPPTRQSSVSPTECRTMSTATPSVIYNTPLGLNGASRELPDIRSCSVLAGSTSFIKSSGVRGTLPRIRKLEVRKQCHMPLADVLVPSGGLASRSEHRSTSEKRPNEVNQHEQDAANALLVLKQCSLKVADMTRSWSHINKVPLCDFIVAQKKCQIMLDNIETLKDVRIQVREATAVEDQNDELTRNAFQKRRRNGLYKSRSRAFSLRSSSVISVVNVIQKERENETRSQSTSSECTTTKSPTEISCDISRQEPRPSYNEPSSQSPSSSDYVKRVLGKIGKTSKSGKNRNTHMKCLQCSATDTPEWRKGPVGPTTLCNACGLFYKKLLKRFGGDTADVIMKMRQIKNPQDRKVPRSISS
ncbi:hypothetical protein HG537_0G03550 [Torulaspora globosa]|uniref:GATA-type domain-containing protein n=1 Tax=Torulaspora globosa TaxID=48254 RepID=A0A7H9HXJ2_9SACH|nr:hypothetical protein HG537_0G03550 [Torulaspora sp. CBS 2947]